MRIKLNYIYLIIITFLISLLIFGYLLNKKSSASKKNEISNILQQLKTRNIQIGKLQKNLFKTGKNINNLINPKEIKPSHTIGKSTKREKTTDIDFDLDL